MRGAYIPLASVARLVACSPGGAFSWPPPDVLQKRFFGLAFLLPLYVLKSWSSVPPVRPFLYFCCNDTETMISTRLLYASYVLVRGLVESSSRTCRALISFKRFLAALTSSAFASLSPFLSSLELALETAQPDFHLTFFSFFMARVSGSQASPCQDSSSCCCQFGALRLVRELPGRLSRGASPFALRCHSRLSFTGRNRSLSDTCAVGVYIGKKRLFAPGPMLERGSLSCFFQGSMQ